MPYSGTSRSVEKGSSRLRNIFNLIGQWPFFLVLTLPMVSQACGPYGGGPTPGKTTPTITWTTPAAITYGTALSGTQLNATASVPGTFTYTPAANTVPTTGTQTLSVSFAPTDTTHYNSATATVSLTVNKATPTITWATPAAINAGTALSATQLDATASVAGSLVYNPASGTVLAAGAQTLSVTFTPTDSTDYTTATDSVSLTVNAVSGGGGVGPSGGTVHGFYGASVTVPAGALTSSVDIEIPRDDTNAPTLPTTGVDAAGAIYALTPHGTTLTTPATVQIPFDSDRIPTDATPVLYKAEPGGSFAPITTTVNGNMLSADVSNFSWVIPGYAATLPRVVYALMQDSNFKMNVSSFKITKGTGALSTATSSAPVGDGAISVTVHPSRRFLYVCNVGSSGAPGAATNVPANSIAVYQLDATTGQITGPTDVQPVNGHPVSVVVHPTGKFIYVVNEVRFGATIGNISAFSIDNATGALTAEGTVADLNGVPATGLAFAPSGEFAYVTYMPPDPQNQNNFDTVKTYGVSTTSGKFTTNPIGTAGTGDNPWSIVVTPGGHFAYVSSLSDQGFIGDLAIYAINQSTGLLTLQNSLDLSGAQPTSLAMDPEARFLYVGRNLPNNNRKLEMYSINPNNGGLSLSAGMLLGPSTEVGPVAVVADPQGEFVYALDGSLGTIVPLKLDATNRTLTLGTPITGVFAGGATGGVGDPFSFAVSGTSPVWQDNCTVQVNDAYVFDGCFTPKMSSGPGSTSSNGSIGGGTPTHQPATAFTLSVSTGPTGGAIISSPGGINLSNDLSEDFVEAGFPAGSGVFLTATPPNDGQNYDVKWTGGCSGDGLGASVTMNQDQSCHVDFTLKTSE